jgi:hypothetical protein
MSSHTIDLQEFMELTKALSLNMSQTRAVKLFAKVDPDCSGYLDKTVVA